MIGKIKKLFDPFINFLVKPIKYQDLSDVDKKTYDYIKNFNIDGLNNHEGKIVKKIQSHLDDMLKSSRGMLGKFISPLPIVLSFCAALILVPYLSSLKLPIIMDFPLFMIITILSPMFFLSFSVYLDRRISPISKFFKENLVNKTIAVNSSHDFKRFISKVDSLPVNENLWHQVRLDFITWLEEKEKKSNKNEGFFVDENGDIVLKDKPTEINPAKKVMFEVDKI